MSRLPVRQQYRFGEVDDRSFDLPGSCHDGRQFLQGGAHLLFDGLPQHD